MPLLESEAKKRQVAAGGDKKSDDAQKSVVQKVAQPIADQDKNKSRSESARVTGTNHAYVDIAVKLKETAPARARPDGRKSFAIRRMASL